MWFVPLNPTNIKIMEDFEILKADLADAMILANLQADVLRSTLGKILGLGHPAVGVIDTVSMESSWRRALSAKLSVWLAFTGDEPTGMAAVLPGLDQTVGELTLEFLARDDNLEVAMSLLDKAMEYGRDNGLRALGIWLLVGDDFRTRFLSDAGFTPQGLSQKLQTTDGDSVVDNSPHHKQLEAHLWGILL